jgi:A/G-specific adenine glycosylase
LATAADLQRTRRASLEGEAAALLLAWYDAERRHLPWRAPPGKPADPYHVWLSEIMLQQTTVKAVIPYFVRFVARWPRLADLAAADLDDVLSLWAGLGYYARARNLHRCARVVMERHNGRFPQSEAALRELPGVGQYTAAAIAAIAFGKSVTPVDGNVERVAARLFAVRDSLPAAKTTLRQLAARLTPSARSGDFAQALMDLGATLCSPRRPSCLMCPLSGVCAARAAGIEAELPVRALKAERPTRHGIAFLGLREDGCLLLRRRPAHGLLAEMMEVPSTEWREERRPAAEALRTPPLHAEWWPVPGVVTHTFTHFRLELQIYRAVVPVESALTFWADAARCRWVSRRALQDHALPSVMRKVIAHGLREL